MDTRLGKLEVREEELHRKLDKLYYLMIGNGKPEESIVFRLKMLEDGVFKMGDQVTELTKILTEHVASPNNNKAKWYDKIIPADTRSTIILWSIRLGLFYLVGDSIFKDFISTTGGLK